MVGVNHKNEIVLEVMAGILVGLGIFVGIPLLALYLIIIEHKCRAKLTGDERAAEDKIRQEILDMGP
jgi:hypothetical protein